MWYFNFGLDDPYKCYLITRSAGSAPSPLLGGMFGIRPQATLRTTPIFFCNHCCHGHSPLTLLLITGSSLRQPQRKGRPMYKWLKLLLSGDDGKERMEKKILKCKFKYKVLVVDEADHSAHDDAKKNAQQLGLIKPQKTHHLPKLGKCHNSNVFTLWSNGLGVI